MRKRRTRCVRWGPGRRARANRCRSVGTRSDGIGTGALGVASGRVWRVPVYWPGGARHGGGVSLVCGFHAERGGAGINRQEERDENARIEGVATRDGPESWCAGMNRHEVGMRESCTEGVATHGGREPCVGAREGAGEASAAVRAGRAIEPRNGGVQGADAVMTSGRQFVGGASASRRRTLRGRRPVHVRNLIAREPGGPAFARPAISRAGRSGNAEAVRLR